MDQPDPTIGRPFAAEKRKRESAWNNFIVGLQTGFLFLHLRKRVHSKHAALSHTVRPNYGRDSRVALVFAPQRRNNVRCKLFQRNPVCHCHYTHHKDTHTQKMHEHWLNWTHPWHFEQTNQENQFTPPHLLLFSSSPPIIFSPPCFLLSPNSVSSSFSVQVINVMSEQWPIVFYWLLSSLPRSEGLCLLLSLLSLYFFLFIYFCSWLCLSKGL